MSETINWGPLDWRTMCLDIAGEHDDFDLVSATVRASPHPVVRIAIDASSDGKRAAYACLMMTPGEKPRVIYGQAWNVPMHAAEAWGIRRAVRRIDRRYPERRRLLIFTDSQQIAARPWNLRVQYRWVSRNTWVITELHKMANWLRRSMPNTKASWARTLQEVGLKRAGLVLTAQAENQDIEHRTMRRTEPVL